MPWSLLVAARLCYEFLSGRDSGAHGVSGNLQEWKKCGKGWLLIRWSHHRDGLQWLMIQISKEAARSLSCWPLRGHFRASAAPPFSHGNVGAFCTTQGQNFHTLDNTLGQNKSTKEPVTDIGLYYKKSYKPHKELCLFMLGTVPISNKELPSQITHHIHCWQDATAGWTTGTRWGWISTKIAWRKAEVQKFSFS